MRNSLTRQTSQNNKRRKLLILGTLLLTASLALAQSKISPDLQTAVNLSSAASKSSLMQSMASQLGFQPTRR
jgi:hypothetical protein